MGVPKLEVEVFCAILTRHFGWRRSDPIGPFLDPLELWRSFPFTAHQRSVGTRMSLVSTALRGRHVPTCRSMTMGPQIVGVGAVLVTNVSNALLIDAKCEKYL